jgi:hypothetical protein
MPPCLCWVAPMSPRPPPGLRTRSHALTEYGKSEETYDEENESGSQDEGDLSAQSYQKGGGRIR